MTTPKLIPISDAEKYHEDKYLIIACEQGHPGFWILLEDNEDNSVAIEIACEDIIIWF